MARAWLTSCEAFSASVICAISGSMRSDGESAGLNQGWLVPVWALTTRGAASRNPSAANFHFPDMAAPQVLIIGAASLSLALFSRKLRYFPEIVLARHKKTRAGW